MGTVQPRYVVGTHFSPKWKLDQCRTWITLMTPRVSWLGDSIVPSADFLECEQLKPVPLPSSWPA